MNAKAYSRVVLLVTLLFGLLVACAAPIAPPTSVPTLTPTSVPTSTPALTDLTEWDLVLISDSSGWGVADLLARFIEEDLGVTVTVYDLPLANLSAGRVLRALRGEGQEFHAVLQNLPYIIPNAEVVVFMASPAESVSAAHPGDWNCVPPPPYYVNDCSMETFEIYAADLNAIYDEILRLRGGAPTIIRAFEYWHRPSLWEEDGVQDACKVCMDKVNATLREAAAAHNVPIAQVSDVFNSPARDEDPSEKGYIGADGLHASDEGQRVIADLLRRLGYDPIAP